MNSEGIFESTLSVLERNLDLRSRKHSLLTSGIANIDTPHYKSFNFHIEEAMEKIGNKESIELKQTNQKHMAVKKSSIGNIELNGVLTEQKEMDLDKLMLDLAENSILYNASAQILSKKYNLLKDSINGGLR
jgi:flagellar basal-body rod protein FlgB